MSHRNRRQVIKSIVEIAVLIGVLALFFIISINILGNWTEEEVPPEEGTDTHAE
ncbi:hypothetical protein NEAUS04_1021 [Nematocida ausubeli]|uniref:Uncharacterized protein n=1 Tax=Nematocida ausubeli (strain ATCC PRA-371 / ERTm2) TaxID=1913371 RepID=H8ZBV6_NEMA1|nr:hypothetical protein NERG_01199 [Nematocida ausubeli]KAI5135611.1 hypothetical protein NEAUS06_1556 [Nematocida ausubeli]KAI5150363.1 hypothetical protein NEAUS05_2137 [Nematocida ausubeli]KAI5162563.1 hypothetical protein NEAUS04_1021 [Nematocida ausubeli]